MKSIVYLFTFVSVTLLLTPFTHAQTPTNPPTYNINGYVYKDLNQNGIKDADESYYNGATIYLSGSTNSATTTDNNGAYEFNNLNMGPYSVNIAVNEHNITTPSIVDIVLNSNTSVNFGIIPVALDNSYISTTTNRLIWRSAYEQSQAQSFIPSHNAKITEIDLKICKMGSPTINPYITLNGGSPDNPSNTPLAISNTVDINKVPACGPGGNTGMTYISFIFDSEYIFEAGKVYWIVFQPITYIDSNNYIMIRGGSTVENNRSATYNNGSWISQQSAINFYEFYNPSSVVYKISGNVYNDYNKNGVKDAREPNYQGITITLSGSINRTAQTDSEGNYEFSNLPTGSYSVDAVAPEGFLNTTTNPVSGQTGNATINFGIASFDSTLIVVDKNINGFGDVNIDQCIAPFSINPDSSLMIAQTPKASIIYFDLSSIPPGAVINSAKLSFFATYKWLDPTLSIYRINKHPIDLNVLSSTHYNSTATWSIPCTNQTNIYDKMWSYPDISSTLLGSKSNILANAWGAINTVDLNVVEFQQMLTANSGMMLYAKPGAIYMDSAKRQNPPYLTVSYKQTTNTPTPTPTHTPTPTPLPTYSISGAVYKDINENGFRDEGEAGYENAEVQLSSGQSATTDSNGYYYFSDVIAGSYTVNLSVPGGYFSTTPNSVNIPLTANTTQNFGITTPHNQPTTTAFLAPDPDSQNEYPNPVTVSLIAVADTGYNIVNTYYAIDNGPQQIYTAPFVVSGAGSHIISYWSIDNANKEEMPHPASTFTISSTATDAQIPTGQATTDIGNGITISGNATSSGYITVTPSSNNNGGPVPAQFKILNTFYEISSTAQFTFPITLTFQYPTNNPNQNLKVMHYTGSSWEQLDTVLSYNSSTQIMTLTATANSLSPFAIVELDETAPIITDFNLSAHTVQNGSTSTITARATDDLTGVSSLSYTLTSSTGQTTTGNMDFISPSGQWYDAIIAPSTGVYSVKLIARDQAENEAVSETKYLAVYDPSAGHVTGGGWIVPDNATRTGVSANGKLNFGFVAKYINGVPNGNLTINYKNDNLEFKSTSLEWLTVSGSIADLQGQVTLNGAGVYTFRAHITDGASDNFDIRIWDVNDSFENPTYRFSNELSGGSIKIHQ